MRRPWRQCAASASAGQGCSLSLKSMRAPVAAVCGFGIGRLGLLALPQEHVAPVAAVCGFARRYVAQLLPVVLVCAGPPPRRGSHSGRRQARGCVRAARRQQRGGCGIGRPLLARSEQAALAAAGCGGVILDSMSSSVGRSCVLAARRRQHCLVASAGRVRVRCRPAARLGSRGQSSRSSVADAKASARRGGGLASSGRGWLGRGAVRRIGR